jgi:hypothetical protein
MASQSLWLESHVDLRDHPKVDLLMDLLAITRRDAVGLLHFVWWRAMAYAPSGDLSDFTDGQIARWADWDGDPGHLVSALKTAGFLTASRELHDWDDYAGRWIDRRRADAERKRTARAVAQRVNGSHPGMSGGHPAGRRPESGVPDLTGPDLTGPDLTGPDRTEPTPTPQPPSPQAGPGERTSRRGRRTAVNRGDEHGSAPPPPPLASSVGASSEPPLTPPTDDDVQRWERARELLRADMSPANWGLLVEPLEPLGRAPDGGLWLRAPPGQGVAGRVATVVRRALLDEGEQQAAMARIVEQ